MEQAWSLLGFENLNLARAVWISHCNGIVQAVADVSVEKSEWMLLCLC